MLKTAQLRNPDSYLSYFFVGKTNGVFSHSIPLRGRMAVWDCHGNVPPVVSLLDGDGTC